MRVLLADDHRLMLDGVRRALEADGGFEIVGETQDGTEVLDLVELTRPELVLLDVRMPHKDGLACLGEILERHPDTKVVMLSASTSPELIAAARRLGASAYLSKTVDPAQLPDVLRGALAGGAWSTHGADASREGAGEGLPEALTEREAAILREVARGLTNAEIARELWVTEQTVKFHLTNIYRKLSVRSRTQATRVAFQLGLVESPLTDDED